MCIQLLLFLSILLLQLLLLLILLLILNLVPCLWVIQSIIHIHYTLFYSFFLYFLPSSSLFWLYPFSSWSIQTLIFLRDICYSLIQPLKSITPNVWTSVFEIGGRFAENTKFSCFVFFFYSVWIGLNFLFLLYLL